MIRTNAILLGILSALLWPGTTLIAGNEPSVAAEPAIDPALYQAKAYRLIGPTRGGRSSAVTGVPGETFTFYMGTAGGGVWKTDDAGTSWRNVSDGFFEASSIGAIAVAPSDVNVLFAGTGEACLRGDVQTGVGLYKSTDAGKTWRRVGPFRSGQIAKVRVHPRDPDLVYAAVLGHAFGPNEERGVYRSKDGGETWERVLFVSRRAGAVDLAMDPGNPRVLYAAIYQVLRRPWTLVSGGEDSGLYKSTDGGDTWTELADGLPTGLKGRIGVAVSPADSNRVYVVAEADDGGGLYRSGDAGATFTRTSRDRHLVTRAFYFSHVVAHPTDADTVYALNFRFHRSIDGGKTFASSPEPHADFHDLWINPENPRVMILGHDGGATVSLNGGDTWSSMLNQPTAEFYRLDVDNRFPYRVYGTQQDNSTISVSSDPLPDWGRNHPDWYAVGGGEQGHIAVHPENPDIVYAAAYSGLLTRYDHSTRQARNIEVYPQLPEGVAAQDMKYRFQMNAPIEISPHDPERVYFCSQHVHVTEDGGQSWRILSPDLTTDDETKQQPAGGPITLDHTGPETFTTIFAFRESPHVPGMLWAGTDDGLVHLSRDGGATWRNVTPIEMPQWGTVNDIELSLHDPGRAFIPVHRYRLDDFTPYVFRTDDYGRSWERLATDGIAPHHFVRVVREDPVRKGLLYAGTEFGMYVSFDDGRRWQSLQLNLPVAQVADMSIHDDDLVVATHGRSFWILDDLTQLRQLGEDFGDAGAHLYTSEATVRPRPLTVYYHLAQEPAEPLVLEVLDESGDPIRSFSSDADELPTETGMNRFEWDLTYPAAEVADGAIWSTTNFGPVAVPGRYGVRLTLGDFSQTADFEVRGDPRVSMSPEDYLAQLELATEISDQIGRTFAAVQRLRAVRDQLEALRATLAEGELAAEAGRLAGALTGIEERLTQTRYEVYLDVCNFVPRMDSRMVYNLNAVYSSDARPTDGSVQLFEDLELQLSDVVGDLEAILVGELSAFNRALAEAGVAHLTSPE